MKITWTLLAKKTYSANIEFLLETWNIEVVQNFILEVERTMNLIKINPDCFEKWSSDITFNKGFIHKNVSFYYKVQNNEIFVYLFWNNLQNPEKLKKHLSNTK